MMKSRFLLPLALLFSTPLQAQDSPPDAPVGWDAAMWELEDSEFTPEAGWRFGRLDNGLRYIVRRNDRPENTALVRMEIAAGSLDERADERGFAHFVEHMAFNGSTNVPEGEMVKLLERLGLAFGADTNASTGFDRTQYKLDLPRAEVELLDTALMLMRETASELTFDPEAVSREKGVILSERRVRNNFSYQNTVDGLKFAYPAARAPERLPIGTVATLEAADAAALRAFWAREYVPADTVIVVVGDFDPALVEAKIAEHFADWRAAPSPEQPDAGPVDPAFAGATDIYLDPALTEAVTLMRHEEWIDRPDTAEERRLGVLRAIGARAIARRIQRLVRSEDPPFRVAAYGIDDFLEAARTGQLIVATEDREWRRGLDAAIDEYRRALTHGFGEAEIAEQVAVLRTSLENAAANAATRSNARFVDQAFDVVHGENVPDGPVDALARFERYADEITPAAVLEALRAEAIALENPLIRFTGKSSPAGGAEALRAAVREAFAREVAPPEFSGGEDFAYTDFGPPGTIVSDTRTEALGIRTLRFANGVMLNLKPTELEDGRIRVELNLDGGNLLQTHEEPLAVELAALIPAGGLVEHSSDELQSILAGRTVGRSFRSGAETFVSQAVTTPRDLELQLQVLAAMLSDPGYRPEGLGPWRAGLEDFFARLGETPGSAYSEAIGPILSDGDPRFSRQPIEAYQALDYGQLRAAIGDRLANGAIEIGIVGDFDEEQAIALIARTLGALPPRETAFGAYDAARERGFTGDRRTYTVTHQGEPDQALVRMVWPTDDDEDWELNSALELLAHVTELKLTETLREELGQTYSPDAAASQSSTYRDYGTFAIGAQVALDQIDAAQEALVEAIEELRAEAPSEDLVQRARQPLLEGLENRLKTNSGWLAYVDRAQSEPDDIARFVSAAERYEAITPERLRELALTYLDPAEAVIVRVVPEDSAP